MTIEFPETLTVTYSVDCCVHTIFNGTHEETFDLSTLTKDDLVQYLAQTLIIKRQSMCRGKKADEAVKIGTWKVPAPGKRISVDPVKKINDLLAKLSPEQKIALMQAMGAAV
jgi:hypothetical protein